MRNNTRGGLVGTNSGTIDSSYSRLVAEGRPAGLAGFCGTNAGSIRQSFHTGQVRNLDAGFCADGERTNCFFFTRSDEAERSRKLPDGDLWLEDASVRSAQDAEALGFDAATWSYTADRQVLAFNEDAWYCKPDPLGELPENGPLGGAPREEVSIATASDLEDLARRVNAGGPLRGPRW